MLEVEPTGQRCLTATGSGQNGNEAVAGADRGIRQVNAPSICSIELPSAVGIPFLRAIPCLHTYLVTGDHLSAREMSRRLRLGIKIHPNQH